jgi:hypothetical protein
MGGQGSGRSREATDAVEQMLAATVCGDKATISKCILKIDVAHRHGASHMSGARVSQLLQRACASLNFAAREAVPNPSEHLGDVRVSLHDGTRVWIEVKGQTKKQYFADITQADYIRDGTDFLRKYVLATPRLDQLIDGNLRKELAIDQKLTFTANWQLEDLWMADLALLETEDKKLRAGVQTASDLAAFMNDKYLVHLSMEGVRYLKISELRPVIAHRAGQKTRIELDTTSVAKVAAIRLAVGNAPGRNSTDFTYHIGYKDSQAAGRHKLHNYALAMSPKLQVLT